MKRKIIAGAAAMALLVSAGANAAFDPDGTVDFGGSGNGDVVLSVVELTGDTANSPYVNVSFGKVTDFLGGVVNGFVVDNNSALDSLIATAIGNANPIQWNVVGIHNPSDLSGFGLVTTSNSAPVAVDYTVMSSAVNNNRTWMTANAQAAGMGDTVTGTNAAGDVQGALSGNKLGLVGQAGSHNVSGGLGESLAFYRHFATDGFLGTGGVADLGDFADLTLQLTYDAVEGARLAYVSVSEVPLPAAAWLFAAAVGLFGTIARRQAQAA